MKTRILNGLALFGALMTSAAAFASGDGMVSGASVGTGLAIGLAAFAAAFSQGIATAVTASGIARNPNARGEVFTPFVLGLAFIEVQAFLGFIIAFLSMG